jgi:hypothetical protein
MPTNKMTEFTTVTGKTLAEAINGMQELLPPDAYTEVPGAGNFTDVDPAYLTLKATEIFGACGFGWAYDYDAATVSVIPVIQKTKNGDRNVFQASIPKFELRFRYLDGEGNLVWSEPVLSTGANANENAGYAMRGSLTNAIGSAFAKLCWQLPTWLNKVTHKNAAALWAQKHGTGQAGNGKAASTENKTKTAQQTANKQVETTASPAASAQAPAAEAASSPVTEPGAAGSNINSASGMTLQDAYTVIIPKDAGAPMAGKTLGEAKNDAILGVGIIKFLTGNFPNQSNVTFKPVNPEQERLQRAALVIYGEMANGDGKGGNSKKK